jgi:hypothetical protein
MTTSGDAGSFLVPTGIQTHVWETSRTGTPTSPAVRPRSGSCTTS